MNNLALLNEMSSILESIACGFSGDAKEGIDILVINLKEDDLVIKHQELIDQLKIIYENINNYEMERAGRLFSPLMRQLWREVMEDYGDTNNPIT